MGINFRNFRKILILLEVKGFQGLNFGLYMEACVMSNIEKAQRAIRHVLHLLIDDKEPEAIKVMELVYQCDRSEAADFVYTVKAVYDTGN